MKKLLTDYPFLQNIHFCRLAGVPYFTIKKYLAGRQSITPDQEKIYLRNYEFLIRTLLNKIENHETNKRC